MAKVDNLLFTLWHRYNERVTALEYFIKRADRYDPNRSQAPWLEESMATIASAKRSLRETLIQMAAHFPQQLQRAME